MMTSTHCDFLASHGEMIGAMVSSIVSLVWYERHTFCQVKHESCHAQSSMTSGTEDTAGAFYTDQGQVNIYMVASGCKRKEHMA
jgi:hypothetical protein